MELLVNGKKTELAEGTTAAALLTQLGIQPERVVVEVNLTVLKRAQVASTILHAGDQVEIVHFVGGGSLKLSIVDCRFSIEKSAIGNRQSKIP